jgi:hypothetical protein
MAMVNVTINIQVAAEVAAALPVLTPQVEQALSLYGAKVLSITPSESNLSTTPVNTDSSSSSHKVEVTPSTEQQSTQVETLHLGLPTDVLEQLNDMCGNLSEEELYADYEVPAVALTPPAPLPVVKRQVVTQSPSVAPAVPVMDTIPQANTFPTTQVDYDLLAKLESFSTYSESNRNDRVNQVVQVHSRVEKEYKLIGVTMKAPLASKQVDSFLKYVGPKVGINVNTMQLFYGCKLVTDPISTDISQLSDNRYFIIKVPTTVNPTVNHQVQYAYTR